MPSWLKSLALSAAFGLVWVATGYVAWGISTTRRYDAAYNATHSGDTLTAVVKRFGPPYALESHIDGTDPFHCVRDCTLRLWYTNPLVGGISPISVDFDSQQRVTGKYQWSSP